ncbi:carbohydrate sulfotransferase 15-like [Haliotis asinina]|uniref:carbohydrate sulfotransferase 15-like n=1 Tax=Haliotis asinina TaxID=109174 RepID=UPI0035321B37
MSAFVDASSVCDAIPDHSDITRGVGITCETHDAMSHDHIDVCKGLRELMDGTMSLSMRAGSHEVKDDNELEKGVWGSCRVLSQVPDFFMDLGDRSADAVIGRAEVNLLITALTPLPLSPQTTRCLLITRLTPLTMCRLLKGPDRKLAVAPLMNLLFKVKMRVKVGYLMLLILLLCPLLWFVTQHSRRMVMYDIRKLMHSQVFATESEGVNIKSVTLDIRCVGAHQHQAEDLFCMERPKYLPNFKNPCWYAKKDGRLRLKCVPYYHVLGVTKSSTTDLAYRIRAHKDVLPCNNCLIKKETFYWSRGRYGYEWSMKERPPCNFSCFQQMFSAASRGIQQKTTRTGYHNMITGDATPSDFFDFRGWPKIPQNAGLEKPVVLTPHLMRHMYTDPKFILIFRNPTDRLYSDYMELGGISAAGFHEAVIQSIQVEEACMKNHTVEHCLYSLDIGKRLRTRIFLGCYSVYMREWLKVFPREQFLILRTEDHDQDPKARLRTVYNYLKLNYTEDWLSSIANVKHQRVNMRKVKQGPMLEKTRVLLDNFYRRYKTDLADVLQDKRFLWGDIESAKEK